MPLYTSPDLDTLGRYIRERRRDRGLTQAQLAETLGWAQERVSTLENGKYGMPSVPALAGLARALGCSLAEVLQAAGFAAELRAAVDGTSADGEGIQDVRYYALQRLFGIEAMSLSEALDESADILAEVMSADKVDALIYDPATASLVVLGSSNTPTNGFDTPVGLVRLPCADGGHEVGVFKTGISYQSRQPQDDPSALGAVAEQLGLQSVIIVPFDMDGIRRGVLVAESSRQNHFAPADMPFLESLAKWVGFIAHRTELAADTVARALDGAQRMDEDIIREEHVVTQEYAGPTSGELSTIVERLDTELHSSPIDRSTLLQIEMTLRGMVPTLEAMLQYAVRSHRQSDRLATADHAVMTIVQHLEWIQLHANAPIEEIRQRVRDSVHNAATVTEQLTH